MLSGELVPAKDDETRALTALAFEELALAAAGIASMHRAIAARAFRAAGPGAAVAHAAHDGISRGVYAGVGLGARAAGRAACVALQGRRRAPLSATPRGSALIAAITGLRGDALEAERSPLHQPMSVRLNGEPVAPEPEALAGAFPDARPCLVVFVHGLMETELSWGGPGAESYGTRLARELGCTPVHLRYNSGRRISENGRSLSELMEALVAAWPVDVERIALVGHSMGGLVARSACWQASEEGAAWVRHVRQSVSLGSPHMGAPLEQAVHVLSAGLATLPETRPLGNFLRRRSGGIRDLRRGSLVDADWRDLDPDVLRAKACQEVPLLEGAAHCFVSATITRSEHHLLGRLLGDCLVLTPSARGRSRTRRLARGRGLARDGAMSIPFEEEYGLHVGGATHFALLRHPAVYERLCDWLR